MGIAADVLRPYWMRGLNEVVGSAKDGLREWLSFKRYQVYSPITATQFQLSFTDHRPLCSAFAADVSRLASAALESMNAAQERAETPQACAWSIIRSYYAAYFAAHAISRVLGAAHAQLDAQQVNAVSTIAGLFSNAQATSTPSAGIYVCAIDPAATQLNCMRSANGPGVHEGFWLFFLRKIRQVENQLFLSGLAQPTAVATKLVELGTHLCLEGKNGGNWLSYIRNEVTYRQGKGAWYPYHNGTRRALLEPKLAMWSLDPMTINLAGTPNPSLVQFAVTCAFLVALCRDLLEEIAIRCPKGRSFVLTGPKAYLNRVRA